MTRIVELLTGFEMLRAQQEVARRQKRCEIVEEARRIMVEFRITGTELGLGRRPGDRPERCVPRSRYRNPETGETWSGRGRAPRWILGKDRTLFAIQE